MKTKKVYLIMGCKLTTYTLIRECKDYYRVEDSTGKFKISKTYHRVPHSDNIRQLSEFITPPNYATTNAEEARAELRAQCYHVMVEARKEGRKASMALHYGLRLIER